MLDMHCKPFAHLLEMFGVRTLPHGIVVRCTFVVTRRDIATTQMDAITILQAHIYRRLDGQATTHLKNVFGSMLSPLLGECTVRKGPAAGSTVEFTRVRSTNGTAMPFWIASLTNWSLCVPIASYGAGSSTPLATPVYDSSLKTPWVERVRGVLAAASRSTRTFCSACAPRSCDLRKASIRAPP